MIATGNVLFRCDASVNLGTGHVMRCLALAQAWQDAGGKAVFAMAQSAAKLQDRLAMESCEIASISAVPGTAEDATETAAATLRCGAQWVIVDGYRFDGAYQEALKAAGVKVLFVDDYGHALKYEADVVLNQNVAASADLYPNVGPQTRLLLGPRYALLRREFATLRDRNREVSPTCRRVLVTMGGSDPRNCTTRAIEALPLSGVGGLRATVLVGGANPYFQLLQKVAENCGLEIRIVRNAPNVSELMAAADVAISAAGSTCWELCFCGVPSLLIDVAPNQTALAKELHRIGCAIHAGDWAVSAETLAAELGRLCTHHELRESLAKRSRDLVDGNGARRVVSVLQGIFHVRLRRAAPGDCRILWEWASDPEVRASSFAMDAIPWETHLAWFNKKLRQDDAVLFVAEDEAGNPAGQIRFDSRSDGEWEVDVSVARPMRGRGLGVELIRRGVDIMEKQHPAVRIHAFVKPSNLASITAFERCGFKRLGPEQVEGHASIHLVFVADESVR